jgi:hypothetical protein
MILILLMILGTRVAHRKDQEQDHDQEQEEQQEGELTDRASPVR